MNKEGFYLIGFTKNQILHEQNQFSSEIPHALQNTNIVCKKPMWFFKVYTGFSKYHQDQKFFRMCSRNSVNDFSTGIAIVLHFPCHHPKQLYWFDYVNASYKYDAHLSFLSCIIIIFFN